MKLFLFIVIFTCSIYNSFSQIATSTLTGGAGQSWATRPVSTADMFPDEVFQKSIYNKYEGSKYLYDSWEMPARIVTTNDKELRLSNINLNLKDNRFETGTLGDSLFIFNNDKIQYVETLFATYIKLKLPKSNEISFFERLLDLEHISLYKHPELKITDGILNPLTQEKKPDVYTRLSTYYFLKNNSDLKEIRLKKKDILNELSDKKDEVSDFAKENNLNYSLEEDLIKILTYYDSL